MTVIKKSYDDKIADREISVDSIRADAAARIRSDADRFRLLKRIVQADIDALENQALADLAAETDPAKIRGKKLEI